MGESRRRYKSRLWNCYIQLEHQPGHVRMPSLLLDLPDGLLARICTHLHWYGQDCMLLASKTTRAAALPIVKAKARKDALLKECMHTLATLVSEHLAGAGDVKPYGTDSFNSSYLGVTRKTEQEYVFFSAVLEANRRAGSVVANLFDHRLTLCIFMTGLPETGHSYMDRRRPNVREFTSLAEAMAQIIDGWKQAGCLK